MTGFDLLVFAIVGIAAIGGFSRGFGEEIVSLAAWVAALFAIHFLHDPLRAWLQPQLSLGEVTAGLVAFAILLLIPYAIIRAGARRAGRRSGRTGPLGPVDRVLGFGFGAIKGAIIAVVAFSLAVLGYDEEWDEEWAEGGRPDWMMEARTYPVISASSNLLVPMIDARRTQWRAAAAEETES